MTTNVNVEFNEVIRNRRAVKSYDPSFKISREEMSQILTEATLAPSAFNLQPWHFLVIESPEAKEKLLGLAPFNSSQVTTSSAVIAVFGDLQLEDRAEEIYSQAVEFGYMPKEIKDKQVPMILQMYKNLPVQAKREAVTLDSGLASMQLMLAAHAHGYATNPMAGFDKEKIAKTFGLDPERYAPIVIISIGKAAAEGRPTVRLPLSEVADWK